VLAWLERLKATQQVPAPATLTPGDALAGGAVSDGESTGASGENGDTGSSAAGEGLVDGERLIPDQTVPVGLFANLSLSATRRSTRVKAQEAVLANPDAQNEDDVGVANETYFMPGMHCNEWSAGVLIMRQGRRLTSAYVSGCSSRPARQRSSYTVSSRPKMWTSCSICKLKDMPQSVSIR
jgi:hypothetical protein